MRHKVVLINYTGRKSGGSVYSYEMAKALIDQGQAVVAVISEYVDNIELWEKLPFEKLYKVRTYNTLFQFVYMTILFLISIRQEIKREFDNFEIIAVYCPMIQPWTYLINSIFKKSKIVVTLHDPEPHSGSSLIWNKLIRFTASKADELVILSEKFKEYSSIRFNKELSHIHVIPHGNFNYYQKCQANVEIVNYPSNKVNFLFFGRISKYKGLKTLAQAYKKVSQKINCTLTIAGSGDFTKYEKDFVGLKDVQVINRWFNDNEVGALFQGNNIIVVLPYIDASQSGVIPIANEYGVPVIATNTGGLSEQVIDNQTGLLVPANDSVQLAEKMVLLALDNALQQRLAEQAKKKSVQNSWNDLSKILIKILLDSEKKVK